MKPQVRFAAGRADRERIKGLFGHGLSQETIAAMRWDEGIEPYWLVAEDDTGIAGALQVLVGRPIGRLDYLCLDESLRPQARARAVKALFERGVALLGAAGCSMASGSVPFELRPWRRAVRARGGVMTSSGSVFHKWVQRPGEPERHP